MAVQRDKRLRAGNEQLIFVLAQYLVKDGHSRYPPTRDAQSACPSWPFGRFQRFITLARLRLLRSACLLGINAAIRACFERAALVTGFDQQAR